MAKVEKKANNFSPKLGHLSVIFMVGTFRAVTMTGSALVEKMTASYILLVTWSKGFKKLPEDTPFLSLHCPC